MMRHSWFERRGVGLLMMVVVLSVLSAVIVATILYLTYSHFKVARREMKGDLLRCVYEASWKRAEYEILYNPEVFNEVQTNGKYDITNFEFYGITPTIHIYPDNDGDGFLDVDIEIPGV